MAAALVRARIYGAGLSEASVAELVEWFRDNPGADETAIKIKLRALDDREFRDERPDIRQALIDEVQATARGVPCTVGEYEAQERRMRRERTAFRVSKIRESVAPPAEAPAVSQPTGASPRETRGRRQGTAPSRDGSDSEASPSSDLGGGARALLRLRAWLERRQARRFAHNRPAVPA